MLTRKVLFIAIATLFVGGTYMLAQHTSTAPLPAEYARLQTCEVHGTPLQLGTAEILYGDRPPLVTDPAARLQFPRAYSYVLGGDSVPRNAPHWQQVKFCPRCRLLESRYLKAHPTPER